ncbi:MAG: hypothetical protein K1X66_00175 [Verrucomicrobiae bacterium]|nr:hypothetical protein [Verrucomicrobiae bacterium]
MRSLYLIIALFSLSASLHADLLQNLYDPNRQIDRNKTSTLAQRAFHAKNFSFNHSALFFNKSLSFDQSAKTERFTWSKTPYFANKKFEKTLPSSLWAERPNTMKLSTFAWQDKTFSSGEPYETQSANAFSFKEAPGFSGKYPVNDYRGNLPVNVSRSLQIKKEKALTIEEIKEILNKNK